MDTAKALVEAGRLTDAIAAVTEEVKAHPADGARRIFLFELLCFRGDLDRAAKQLDVLSTRTANAGEELTVQVYRGLLSAEARRRDVYHGTALPKFVTSPPQFVEQHALLVKKLDDAPAEAIALLEQAEESTPPTPGERSGQPFNHVRDADDRLGGILEVFHGTEDPWIPFSQVVQFEVLPPRKLRDLMWAQVRLEVVGQPVGEVFVPALYVDSYRHADAQVALGRRTEWQAIDDQLVVGTGQRVFLVDGEDLGIFDLGHVSLTQPTPEPAA